MPNRIPKALTIAGSDSGGGAGIQADLKTFHSLGVYGTSVITALTAQNSVGVFGVHPVPGDFVEKQFDAVMNDIGCDAAKIGMLANAEIIEAVARCLDRWPIEKLVVDPVMISTSGQPLLDDSAVDLFIQKILPRAFLLTPNIPEAERLTNRTITSVSGMMNAAEEIGKLGPRAVLVKGGHLNVTPGFVDDVLFDGKKIEILSQPRNDNPNTHGTGCVLAAAYAAYLARGLELKTARSYAHGFLYNAINAAYQVGKGPGPVNPWVIFSMSESKRDKKASASGAQSKENPKRPRRT